MVTTALGLGVALSSYGPCEEESKREASEVWWEKAILAFTSHPKEKKPMNAFPHLHRCILCVAKISWYMIYLIYIRENYVLLNHNNYEFYDEIILMKYSSKNRLPLRV